MVQVNYPYATNFEANLPAWPTKAACTAAITIPTEEEEVRSSVAYDWTNIKSIGRAYNIWTNVG